MHSLYLLYLPSRVFQKCFAYAMAKKEMALAMAIFRRASDEDNKQLIPSRLTELSYILEMLFLCQDLAKRRPRTQAIDGDNIHFHAALRLLA